MAVLRYQGHGSYRITTAKGVVVYIDPYAGTGYDLPADLVLITHEHYDHTNTSLVTLKKEGMIIRERDLLPAWRLPHTTVKGISLPPYRRTTPTTTETNASDICWGWTASRCSRRDTSTTKEMQDMKPPSGLGDPPHRWHLQHGTEGSTACAQMIGAKHTIPVHMKPGALFDPQMAAAFTPPGRVILHPGEEITLD
jgi:L-ascorbate metabolism protein UlaG (beta-lactamase superfamily)